jgi:DNA invertase Pin-like site-specific DNA recombinase
MKKYGYIRVSTKEQNPERQIYAMEAENIKKQNIYIDKITGKGFDRPQYCRMLKRLKAGDIVVIKSIDRLGRNYNEILEQWRIIIKEKCADIQVIDMPLLNTNQRSDNLTGVFISDLVLQILAYVAETERTFIRQRQAEGIAVAKRKGKKFGRNKNVLPENFLEYYQKWKNKEITIRQAAEALNMNYSTFYRRCKEYEKETCVK